MSLAMKLSAVLCMQWDVPQPGHLQAGKMQIATAWPAMTCEQHQQLLDHRGVPAFKPADKTNTADADGWG